MGTLKVVLIGFDTLGSDMLEQSFWPPCSSAACASMRAPLVWNWNRSSGNVVKERNMINSVDSGVVASGNTKSELENGPLIFDLAIKIVIFHS